MTKNLIKISKKVETNNKTKVAMVVLNAISHDIRVLKEARSLQSANYDVSIIGVLDRESFAYEEVDGIKIFRVENRGLRHTPVAALITSLTKTWKIRALIALTVCYIVLQNRFSLGLFWLHDLPPFLDSLLSHSKVIFFLLSILILTGDFLYRTIINFFKPLKEGSINISKTFYELNNIRQRKELILKRLEEIDPDIVHCHDLNALIIGAAYKMRNPGRYKLVYDSHEIFEETNQSHFVRRHIFSYIQKKLSTQVDGFITINQSIADYIRSKYPKLPEAHIIKNATVFKTFIHTENMFHKLLEIPQNKKIVLFQGGFTPGRGLIELVTAAGFLRGDWLIVFMGWGKLQSELEKIARNNNSLNSRVYFCDKVSQEELPYWTASATIGIIPYQNTCLNHFYCTPNKLWEYTLGGIPILASPFPEIKKVIDHGVGWLLEDPIDPRNIASTINRLSDSDIEIAKQKSKEFIKNDNWSKYEARLLSLYNGFHPLRKCA